MKTVSPRRGRPKRRASTFPPSRTFGVWVALALTVTFIASATGLASAGAGVAPVSSTAAVSYSWKLTCSTYGPLHGVADAGWSWLHNSKIVKSGVTGACAGSVVSITGGGTRPSSATGIKLWVGGNGGGCAKNTTTIHFAPGGHFTKTLFYHCTWTSSGGFRNSVSASFNFKS